MDKEFIDELYHQLRVLYLEDDVEQKEAIRGIVSHLTNPDSSQGDYTGLLKFSSWYGTTFLLPKVRKIIDSNLIKADRIVELGAGLSWLGRGLGSAYNVPTLFIDKRQWVFTDIVADIESTNGVKRVLDELKPGDLIVMSELLHCLDRPEKVMERFKHWPMIVIEYLPSSIGPQDYAESYKRQISCFGCKPVESLRKIFHWQNIIEYNVFPYTIAYVRPI